MAWTTRYLAMEDQDALHRAREMVHGLKKIAVWHGDVCWFPSSTYPGRSRLERRGAAREPREGHSHRSADYFPAGPFRRRNGRRRSAESDAWACCGSFESSPARSTPTLKLTQYAGIIFTAIPSFLQSVLKYALMTREDELVAWVRAGLRPHLRERHGLRLSSRTATPGRIAGRAMSAPLKT